MVSVHIEGIRVQLSALNQAQSSKYQTGTSFSYASRRVARVDRKHPYLYPPTMALSDIDIGRNVRETRVERKMTQADLANLVFLDRTAISRLESGQRTVTAPELASIATALNVEIGSLAAVDGKTAPSTRHSPERKTSDVNSPPQWMQIHVPGSRMGYLVGPGHGWVPAITLADISEAPITKVISHPSAL
jgi:transcriptional regulator with XRE-family HTH domain